MPMMKKVLGLDLGSYSLKAVELRQTFRGLEPVQFREQLRGAGDQTPSDVLRQFVAEYQLPTDQITCAMAGDLLTLHRLEFPFRDKGRLGPAVRFGVEDQIPFDLDDIILDWALVGGEERSAQVAAVLAQRRNISELVDWLSEADAEPRVIEAEGMALANLCAIYDLSGQRLIVDLGHNKTTLCLVLDEVPVWSRSFRVGGRHVTEAIATDLAWNPIDAERWKCEEGLFDAELGSRSPGAVAVLDRIAREISGSLTSLESLLGGAFEAQLDCITLVGGGAHLHRLGEYLTGRTGVVATTLGPPPVEADAALVSGGDALRFAPAMALALRGTARARTRMNFRKDELAYRTDLSRFVGKDMRGSAILAGVAAVLFGASVAASSVLESDRAGDLEDQVSQIYAATFPGQPIPDKPVAALSQAIQSARDRADFLGVYGDNLSALDLLAELSRRVASTIDAVFEEVSIDPKVVRIKASGPNYEVPDRVIEELTRAAPFQNAKVTGEIKRVKDRVTFNISIPLDGEVQGE